MRVSVSFRGADEFRAELLRMRRTGAQVVAEKTVQSLLHEAAQDGAVPFDTGELQRSAYATKYTPYHWLFGFGQDGLTGAYATPVELGHVTNRKDGTQGYVEGRYYLRKLVDDERPRFNRRCREMFQYILKRAGGKA